MKEENKFNNNLTLYTKNDNKKRKTVSLLILLFVVLASGITYAFFTATVSGGDKASKVNINTATLGLKYSEDPITCASNGIMPGASCTHNFYVENTGNVLTNYYVYIIDVINKFVTKSDLVYSITCESVNTVTGLASGTCSGKSEATVPAIDELIVNQNIDKGLTHKYTIAITFKETGVNQNNNQGKEFSGKILVATDKIKILDNHLRLSEQDGHNTLKFLDSPFQRQKIESISFETTNIVPANVLGSWDVSEKKNSSIMAWYTDVNTNGLYEVIIGQNNGVTANQNSSNLFNNLNNVVSINLTNFNTESVTTMSDMFADCRSLVTLNLSGFKTNNVTNMSSMFSRCISLASLDLRMFETKNVKNMFNMFGMSFIESSFTTINLSSFITENVTNMSQMFSGCNKLVSIDLSSFVTSNVTSMDWMFFSCSSLIEIDLSKFDTSKVKSMENMFARCSSVISLDLSTFNTDSINYLSSMFNDCTSLISLNLSSFNSNEFVSPMMFSGCTSLANLDIRNLNFTKAAYFHWMFDSVPTTVSIITNSFSEAWLKSEFPTYTNITTV